MAFILSWRVCVPFIKPSPWGIYGLYYVLLYDTAADHTEVQNRLEVMCDLGQADLGSALERLVWVLIKNSLLVPVIWLNKSGQQSRVWRAKDYDVNRRFPWKGMASDPCSLDVALSSLTGQQGNKA